MAAAGPIACVAIGLGCYALAASRGWSPQADVSPSTAVLGWLGYINISLASHEIKGLPRDRWASAPLSDVTIDSAFATAAVDARVRSKLWILAAECVCPIENSTATTAVSGGCRRRYP